MATRGPQRLAWLTVKVAAEDEDPRSWSPAGALFGAGIEQVPYPAEYREEWRDEKRRPLFTLRDLPVGLPALLRRWRAHEADENPFVELYRLVLFQTDMPARARFLYLVQALEALHARENRSNDERSQRRFEEKREALLADIQLAVKPTTFRFLKRNWSRSRPDSLDRRLTALIKALPARVRDAVEGADMGAIAADLRAGGVTSLPTQLRILRNHLSHGHRNYSERALRPWVRAVETICRGHLLRLLGFDSGAIESALGRT